MGLHLTLLDPEFTLETLRAWFVLALGDVAAPGPQEPPPVAPGSRSAEQSTGAGVRAIPGKVPAGAAGGSILAITYHPPVSISQKIK